MLTTGADYHERYNRRVIVDIHIPRVLPACKHSPRFLHNPALATCSGC